MKILELRFKNLNSLYGEWIIDFTDPEYVSNGIFALTGPTGAGKSTILDAICLALYGATPRLGKITKSGNEIMSRQTGECYAEVLFESQAGRFRCHWEQRRARKNAIGKLQDQEHHISYDDTKKLIENKKSLVSCVIEKKTGMDFNRFTRSILLAQGGFDTFLKADIEEKSKILEQLTGSEIYSEISRRVHERQRSERGNLNLLQAEISSIMILNQGEERVIQQELATKQKQEIEICKQIAETQKAIIWRTAIAELNEEILDLTRESSRLRANIEKFKPEQTKLEQSIKAASLNEAYATLTAMRKQQAIDQAALKTEQAGFLELEISTRTQNEVLKVSEQCTIKTKNELKKTAPLIQRIRTLDEQIIEQTNSVTEGTDACTKETKKIKSNKQARVKALESRAAAQKQLETAEQYLNKHARDEWLVSGITGIEEQFNNLLAKQQEITKKETQLTAANTTVRHATEKLEAATRQCSDKKQVLIEASNNLQQNKKVLTKFLDGKLLREYRNEKDTLLRELTFIRRIYELEDYRMKLVDGKACPLCGSTDHPFAKGNVPIPDKIEQKIESLSKIINQADELEVAIKKLEITEADARDNLYHCEKLEKDAATNVQLAIKTLEETENVYTKLCAEFDELKLTVSRKLQPLGITEIPESKVESLLESLKSKILTWQEQVNQKINIENKIDTIDREITRLDAVIDTQFNVLSEKQANLKLLKKELNDRTIIRWQLYDNKNTDEEEARLNQEICNAEKLEKKARNLHFELQKKWTTIKTHVESLTDRIKTRTPELIQTENNFLAALTSVEFADEKAFLSARLPPDDLKLLSCRAKRLNDEKTVLTTKQKDIETRLARETTKKITHKTLEQLTPQLKQFEHDLKECRDLIACSKHKLNENTVAKERIKKQQYAIDLQKKESLRWDNLHELIGSVDGKKYRNFAQGLTFELLVANANQQLEKMTDRYLLIRDQQLPLILNVVDNYQAGEIRSTKNLSGGESFIVSLSLALGLSKMASRKVRVDSMFLDEGFGTLDEDALETALETLSSLQLDGKLIGIISHVPALKERILTQINITPISGGRSSISGPSCTSKNKNHSTT